MARPLPQAAAKAHATLQVRPDRSGRTAAGDGQASLQERPLGSTELHDGLSSARIHNHYQPVVRLRDRVPVGLEVLARLDHPERGLLAPDLFVPQIEDAGLAFQLTQAVVTRACADWSGPLLEQLDLTLALNFPLDVLLQPAALAWLDRERLAAGIPAARIGIELTESLPITDMPGLSDAVAALRAAGYTLAIDDVGPGVRQEQQLLGLGFAALKLDKGLVTGSRDDRSLANMLDATVAAAHAAGMIVVAEGVEDESSWQRMLAAGVEQAQGFLIAQPMPPGAVRAWYQAWRAGHPPTDAPATN
jgi:EAL domain-containing protein (putative c-di-GMP-specific phosphodiesterase class I)